MSTPIIRKPPPFVDFFRTDEDAFPPLLGPTPRGPDQYSDGLKSSSSLFQTFSIGTLFSFGIGGVAAKPMTNVGWLDFFAQLAGSVESFDLDLYDVPTNRGTGLCRFSEYTPRASRPEACSVSISPNTKARVHAEIRPIKDTSESLITRLTIDYTPNVISLIKTFPDLEIDGFAAVDPPDMEFDQSFLLRDKTVKSVKGGDFKYENPMASTIPLHTSFDSSANPPPDGHRDWMFRFMPVEKNLISEVEEAVADGKGPLMLWAFLPTFGLTDPDRYKKLGIRYNTFPRHFGDLVKFLSPMFDPKQSPGLRNSAPYINPNSEYIDSQGARQKIPDDAAKVVAINEERAKFGRPAIGRNRGTVIDWIFTDLANDEERVKTIKKSDWPKILGHIRLRDTLLNLPIGQIGVDRATDIEAYYHFTTYKDSKDVIRPRLGLTGTIKPLSLNNIDVQIGGFRVQAKSLKADKVKVLIPHFSGLINNGSKDNLPLTVRVEGLKVEEFKLEDATGNFNIAMPAGELGAIQFVKGPKGWTVEIDGLKEDSLKIKFPTGELSVKQANVPPETDSKDPKKIRVVQSLDDDGNPLMLSVQIPEINSTGGITLGQNNGSSSSVQMQGSSKLSNLQFFKAEEKSGSRISASFDFSGGIDSGRIEYGPLGIVQFNTVEDQKGTPVLHPVSGQFNASVVIPKDPTQPKPPPDYSFTMKVPYFSFGTEGRLTMKPGASTVRDATVSVAPGGVSLEGDLDLNASQLKGLGPGSTELGRFLLTENSPNIVDLKIKGRAAFQFKKDGWSLRKGTGNTDPLKISFKLKDSELQHHPDLDTTVLDGLKASKIVGTKVKITEAQVDIDDLRQVEYSQFEVNGEKRGRLSSLDAGPISIHHVEGSGSIWVNLAIWGFVRGLFPSLGSLGGGETKTKWVKRPDPAPLTDHLPTEVKTQLGKGDFFRLGKVFFRRSSNGDWTNQFEDLLLNLHEEGGRGQFGMVRIPNLDLNLKTSATDPAIKDFTFDFGKGDFFVNIFLNDPDRGGSFRFVRWPEKPKP